MKLQVFEHARKLFDEVPNPTLPSFNALVSGYSQNGCFKESTGVFRRLRVEGLCPNSVSTSSLLSGCRTVEQGHQLHGLSLKLGLESEVYVATALITMYLNFGEVVAAQKIFEVIEDKKIVSRNAMISGCLKIGAFHEALDAIRDVMESAGEQPNSSTLLSVISVCTELSDLLLGKGLHCYAVKHGQISDVMISTSLIDMYSKCGALNLASRIFVNMESRNLVTWNAMISSLLSHGCTDDATELFQQMRLEDLNPDSATWNIMINGYSQHSKVSEAFEVLKQMQEEGISVHSIKCLTSLFHACSSALDLKKGRETHAHVIRTGSGYDDELLYTALVDMYMKCGCCLQACKVFNQLERKSGDPAIWNAMISGYGRNGKNCVALEIFQKMHDENVQPNSATFLSVLSACSHAGLVEEGLEIFRMMHKGHGISPKVEHFSAIADLLGRAGKLSEAWNLLQELHQPSASMYSSLLGACSHYSEAKLGELVAEDLLKFDPGNPTPLVILSNIFAGQERWNIVESLRKSFQNSNLSKSPGCSWIGVT